MPGLKIQKYSHPERICICFCQAASLTIVFRPKDSCEFWLEDGPTIKNSQYKPLYNPKWRQMNFLTFFYRAGFLLLHPLPEVWLLEGSWLYALFSRLLLHTSCLSPFPVFGSWRTVFNDAADRQVPQLRYCLQLAYFPGCMLSYQFSLPTLRICLMLWPAHLSTFAHKHAYIQLTLE